MHFPTYELARLRQRELLQAAEVAQQRRPQKPGAGREPGGNPALRDRLLLAASKALIAFGRRLERQVRQKPASA